MDDNKPRLWKKIKNNIRNRLLSAMLIVVPFGVTLLVIRWLFLRMAALLHPIVSNIVPGLAEYFFTGSVPPIYLTAAVSALSVIFLLLLLYLVGAIAQFVVGKRLIAIGEMLLLKIPIVRTIYTSTKQVVKTMSLPDRTAFKSVVLLEFPRPGFRAIGFLTGQIADTAGKKFCKVFIPTTPNPTSGFFEIVPTEEVTEIAMSVEDAFKTIISGGIVSPDALVLANRSRTQPMPMRS
ncbi:MAG TPA: DUF502 domain-containing protein [Sedimentisphaerales bacterium]|nr:DUF502 domain-containing protein [Sedimentisphaerales bacterium]